MCGSHGGRGAANTGFLAQNINVPASNLIRGAGGYLYGTSPHGGDNGNGCIFRMSPAGVIETLYSFGPFIDFNSNADGAFPVGRLCIASDGNLYGVTSIDTNPTDGSIGGLLGGASGNSSAAVTLTVRPVITWIPELFNPGDIHPTRIHYVEDVSVWASAGYSIGATTENEEPGNSESVDAPFGMVSQDQGCVPRQFFPDVYDCASWRQQVGNRELIINIPLGQNQIKLERRRLTAFATIASAENAEGAGVSAAYHGSVYLDQGPIITTTTLPAAKVGQPYNYTVQATGGLKPYSWVMETHGLPEGLQLVEDAPNLVDADADTNLRIVGTPHKAGTYTVDFTVYDTFLLSGTRSITITVQPADPLQITGTLPQGALGRPYQATLTATGGYGSYFWTLASGQLGEGLFLERSGMVAGLPIGLPVLEDWDGADITVKVQDQSGQTATATIPNFLNVADAVDPDTGETYPSVDPDDTDPVLYPWRWSNIGYPDDSSTSGLSAFSVATMAVAKGTRVQAAKVRAPRASVANDLPDGPTPAGWTKATVNMNVQYAYKALDSFRAGSKGGLAAKSNRGNTAWFVNLGNPYIGNKAEKGINGTLSERITLGAWVNVPENHLVFIASSEQSTGPLPPRTYDLYALYNEIWNNNTPPQDIVDKFTAFFRRVFPDRTVGARSYRDMLDSRWKEIAEVRMWERVSQLVEANPTKVGEVILRGRGRFSRSDDGNFLVCADPARMEIRGRLKGLVTAMKKANLLTEGHPAFKMATLRWIAQQPPQQKQFWRLLYALRFTEKGAKYLRFAKGGLVILQVVGGTYEFIVAEDKARAAIKVLAGTVGGTVAATVLTTALVAKFGEPILVAAGPPGWLAIGAIELVAGGVGYYVASHTATYVYDLVMNPVGAGGIAGWLRE